MNVYGLHIYCLVWCDACIYQATTLYDKVTLHSVCNRFNWL